MEHVFLFYSVGKLGNARLTLVLLCCNICKKMLQTKTNCVTIKMEIMK